MKKLTILAPAKINWALDVVGKLPNGYHELSMLMQRISLYDTITIIEAESDSIVCDKESIPNDESNIALKAWLTLKKKLGLSVCLALEIKKEIPVAAGLAGGSADAAAVLKGVNRFLHLGLSDMVLAEIGLSLGADVPFCLLSAGAWAKGMGEILEPIYDIPRYDLVLANPGFPVLTADIFRSFSLADIKYHPDIDGLLTALRAGDLVNIGYLMANLLEETTIGKFPQVGELKEDMISLGLQPLMSGSGASVFAVAKNQQQAQEAAEILEHKWLFAQGVHTL